MKRYTPILFLLLCACGGGGGSDNPPNTIAGEPSNVITGNTTALVKRFDGGTKTNIRDYYVPEDIDTTQPPAVYEPLFAEPGRALMMRAKVIPTDDTPTPNGNPVATYPLTLALRYMSAANAAASCARPVPAGVVRFGNGAHTSSCAEEHPNGVCVIRISTAQTEEEWGHMLWHCITGDFHP